MNEFLEIAGDYDGFVFGTPVHYDFENGTAEIIRLADWDTIKTNWFAKEAIRYILSLLPDALTKYMLKA